MTQPALRVVVTDEPLADPRQKFLWRFLQVVAVGSWIPLIHLSLAFVGYRASGWEFMDDISFLALPPLTLFALLSFFFDRHASRAWVMPSNLVFSLLSIGPAVVCAYLQAVMVLFLVFGTMTNQ